MGRSESPSMLLIFIQVVNIRLCRRPFCYNLSRWHDGKVAKLHSSRRSGSRLLLRRKRLVTINLRKRSILPCERQSIRKSTNRMGIFKRHLVNRNRSVRMWARPEMKVTFRAEVMPGRSREERTFIVRRVLSNGRVELHGFPDEHREGAFEPINFLRSVTK